MAARSPELLRYLWARSASRSLPGRPDRWRPGEESIRELQYYRRTLFVPQPGPTSEEAQAAAAQVAGPVATRFDTAEPPR